MCVHILWLRASVWTLELILRRVSATLSSRPDAAVLVHTPSRVLIRANILCSPLISVADRAVLWLWFVFKDIDNMKCTVGVEKKYWAVCWSSILETQSWLQENFVASSSRCQRELINRAAFVMLHDDWLIQIAQRSNEKGPYRSWFASSEAMRFIYVFRRDRWCSNWALCLPYVSWLTNNTCDVVLCLTFF